MLFECESHARNVSASHILAHGCSCAKHLALSVRDPGSRQSDLHATTRLWDGHQHSLTSWTEVAEAAAMGGHCAYMLLS